LLKPSQLRELIWAEKLHYSVFTLLHPSTMLSLHYYVHMVLCASAHLGVHVQAIHLKHDAQLGNSPDAYTLASGSCPPGYAAISSTSECDAAASALGLTPGPGVSHAWGGSCAKWDGGWGAWGSTWYWHYGSTQFSAELICAVSLAPTSVASATLSTPSPTPSPTSSPTPSPTLSPTLSPTPSPSFPSAPASQGAIAAVGDPHLQNIHGERFDVMKPGRHVLIHIPRGEPFKTTLLHVEAEASRLGGQCSDMYFQRLNVSGAWAEARQPGGYHFESQSVVNRSPEWISLGKLELKVVHGRTEQGTPYLNFYVKHLRRVGRAVGGLLGEDDHSDVETPLEACAQRISLLAQSADMNSHASALSLAVASLE